MIMVCQLGQLGNFTIYSGEIEDIEEYEQAISDIRYHYDRFRDSELRKRFKKAGIVTGIIITVGGLITGLALGLRRKGSDFVRDSKDGAKIGPERWVPV